MKTVHVQTLSDSACERILAQKEEEEAAATEQGEIIQAGTNTTIEKIRELAGQDWFPWAVAGAFALLWATKRKERKERKA